MPPFVAKNLKVWMDGFDISGDLNMVGLSYASELQEDTAFGDDTKSNNPGLKVGGFEMEGYWQAGLDKIDEILFGRVGLAGLVVTVGGENGAEGEIGYLFRPVIGEYSPGASIGEMMKFSASGQAGGHRPLVRGTIIHNALKSVDGNGTAFNLGALGTTQKLYATLHVLSIVGTSIAVIVQSDDAQGFGTPTNRIVFTTATLKGAQYAVPLAGPITDNWWRVNYDLTGTSATFVVAVGLL